MISSARRATAGPEVGAAFRPSDNAFFSASSFALPAAPGKFGSPLSSTIQSVFFAPERISPPAI